MSDLNRCRVCEKQRALVGGLCDDCTLKLYGRLFPDPATEAPPPAPPAPAQHPCCSAPLGGPHKFGCHVYGRSQLALPAVVRDGRFKLGLAESAFSLPEWRYLVEMIREDGETTAVEICPVAAENGLTLGEAFRQAKRAAGWYREIPK